METFLSVTAAVASSIAAAMSLYQYVKERRDSERD